MDIISRASFFAEKRHENQRRKYTNEPYFVHLMEVARLLVKARERSGLRDEHLVAAGYLHDILEDTDTTFEELVATFGGDIAGLVLEVTDISKPGDGNRATRKAIDREHLSRSSPRGATLKLADLISNSRDIIPHDPEFAKVYLAEKRDLLPFLRHGDPELFRRASEQVEVEEKV